MNFVTYKDWLTENSQEARYLPRSKDLLKMQSEIPFYSKMRSYYAFPTSFSVGDWTDSGQFIHITTPDASNFLYVNPYKQDEINGWIFPSYLLSQNYGGSVESITKKFEKTGFVEFFPEYLDSSSKMRIIYDEGMKPGEIRVEEPNDWDERLIINFYYNAESYTQLKETIEECLNLFFEIIKKVRVVVLPRFFREFKSLRAKYVEEVKKIYEKIIDEYKENPIFNLKLVDDSLFTSLIIKICTEEPKFIDDINKLPKEDKIAFFESLEDILGEVPDEFTPEILQILRKSLDIKDVWY